MRFAPIGWHRAQTHGLCPALRSAVSQRLTTLTRESAAAVCTCSTLGPLVAALNLPNLIRIDQPLMAAAASHSGTTLLALCLDSTRQASHPLLIEQAYLRLGKSPDYAVVACADAWPAFEAGEQTDFGQRISNMVIDTTSAHRASGLYRAGSGIYGSRGTLPTYRNGASICIDTRVFVTQAGNCRRIGIGPSGQKFRIRAWVLT